MRAPRFALAVSAAFVAAAVALAGQDPRATIPVLPAPPPLPAEAWKPARGPVRVTLRDVAFTTSLGARVRIPLAELVAPAPFGRDTVRVRSVRVAGASLISPADSIDTPFDPFLAIPGPRVIIDRVTLEDAVLGARAHPSQYEGEWLWRQEDVDVVLERIRFGAGGTVAAAITRADFRGEIRGRPLAVERLAGWLTRNDGTLASDLSASLGTTWLDLSAMLRRNGAYALQLAADTLLFEEVRAVLRDAPESGSAAGVVRVSGDGDAMRIGLPALRAYAGESSVLVRGAVRTGADAGADSLILETPMLRAADLETALGRGLPVAGEWRGALRADGRTATSLRVDGALDRTDGAGRLALEGAYRGGAAPAVRAVVNAQRLPLVDGELNARLELDGPTDAIALAGGFDLRSPWPGTNGVPAADETRLTGTLDGRAVAAGGAGERRVSAQLETAGIVRGQPVSATATATAALDGGRAVDGRFRVAPVPLAALPLPAALDSVRGTVAADGTVTGTLGDPVLTARMAVADGAFAIAAVGVRTTDFAGSIAIEDGVARIEQLGGRAGGGRIELEGRARILGGPRSIDVRAVLRDIALFDGDTAIVAASGEARVRGELGAPGATADVELRSPGGAARRARIEATAVLADSGALDVRIAADSLPLAIVPVGEAIRGVHGTASGRVTGSGTLAEPVWTGALRVRDAGLTVVRSGTTIHSMEGDVRVAEDAAAVTLAGRAGPGTVRFEGSVRLARAPRTISLALRADSALLVATDSAHVIAAADLSVDGALAAPRLDGTIALLSGWIHEDNFKRQAPIDPAAPPYEELRRRVPWFEPRADEEPPLAVEAPAEDEPQVPPPPEIEDGPAFTGAVTVEILPGISIIDEDSEMFGRGTIEVRADSSGITADGIYRIHDGFYANFGERFRVVGGAFVFAGTGVEPRVALRAEHEDDTPLVSGIEPRLHAFEWYPPLEFFAIGTPSVVSEQLRRSALLPEGQTDLAAYLLTQNETQPVTGWRARPFWPSGDGGELAGARAGAQSLPLLWAYIADEGYDYVPLSRAWLRAGMVEVGSEHPARIMVSPLLRAAARAGRWQAILSQPTAAWPRPGLRLRYRTDGIEAFVFEEPRYRSASRLGGGLPAYEVGRRSGIGLRWRREF